MDLAGTDFMIWGLETARLAGGDLRIAHPGTQVATVLQLTGMHQILHAYPAVEECFELASSDASQSAA